MNVKTHNFYFIINPTSGGGKGIKQWQNLKKKLVENNIIFENIFTKNHGHAIQLAQEAAENGFEHIIGLGGDGTANEIANGILKAIQLNPEIKAAMSLFSCGTGNDWVKEHKISRKIEKFVLALKNPQYTLQDVGLIHYTNENEQLDQKYFINVAGLAYDAFVVKQTENIRKSIFLRKFYLLHIFKNLLKYKPEKVQISTENTTWEQIVYTINIGQCRFSGGNMQLVPHAKPNSEKLAVTVAGNLAKLEILLQTPRFYNGKLTQHKAIEAFECDHIEIKSLNDKEVMIEADGEFLGYTPVKIANIPKKLLLFGVNSK